MEEGSSDMKEYTVSTRDRDKMEYAIAKKMRVGERVRINGQEFERFKIINGNGWCTRPFRVRSSGWHLWSEQELMFHTFHTG